ncbi:MAG: NAD(P)(+) transhydrogenase (Re/Si-specific) subunit beta [Deltaproteobacteria bacterium]|nr:NAD(P)(+) transhydrogenase (Re/Si-specific) subunit beta [Deltaproteobacteria bacterium]
MTTELEVGLYIFILAGFLGYHVITRVPPLLHTPLMSATNANSGISLIGSLLVTGAQYDTLSTVLGTIAVACSSTNVAGGFLITDRMLKMFKKSGEEGEAERRQERLMLLVFGVLVAAVVAALVVYGTSGAAAHSREALAAHALRYFYIVSAFLFILGLKGLSSPRYARRGMFLAEFGMVLAIAGTLFHPEIVAYGWIVFGLVVGSLVGGAIGLQIPMTAVPQRTALSHSLGALAATLIGVSEYVRHGGDLETVKMTAISLEVMIGGLTFTGSLMAAAKLQELLPGRPITYRGQNVSNLSLFGGMIALAVTLVFVPSATALFFVMVAAALLFGFLLVVPIGAADMPVVIALLNSYAGLADASMGFVLMNKIQIITGSLDGTSGFLLSLLMCRAMNRSAANVLFGAFGKVEPQAAGVADELKGTVRSIVPDEVPGLLDGARSVIIVPGYGMAVAQAQHGVAELARLLGRRGIDVKYAIHPVAGRMPGHMNVLLAEADVPYDQLWEMEQINPYFPEADLALVVGANDVTNPAARSNKSSPLYGMPILEVDRAKSIIVLKRSMRPGFAGVDNELYFNEKCMMLFGDAKESLTKLFLAMKS